MTTSSGVGQRADESATVTLSKSDYDLLEGFYRKKRSKYIDYTDDEIDRLIEQRAKAFFNEQLLEGLKAEAKNMEAARRENYEKLAALDAKRREELAVKPPNPWEPKPYACNITCRVSESGEITYGEAAED